MKSIVAASFFVATSAFAIGINIPKPDLQAEKQKAIQAQKANAAEGANKAVNKAAEFHVGPPISDAFARIAKEKNQGPDGSTAKGTFSADCTKKPTDKGFDCLIKPEIDVRQK